MGTLPHALGDIFALVADFHPLSKHFWSLLPVYQSNQRGQLEIQAH